MNSIWCPQLFQLIFSTQVITDKRQSSATLKEILEDSIIHILLQYLLNCCSLRPQKLEPSSLLADPHRGDVRVLFRARVN